MRLNSNSGNQKFKHSQKTINELNIQIRECNSQIEILTKENKTIGVLKKELKTTRDKHKKLNDQFEKLNKALFA